MSHDSKEFSSVTQRLLRTTQTVENKKSVRFPWLGKPRLRSWSKRGRLEEDHRTPLPRRKREPPPIGDGDPAPVDERVEDLKLKVRLFLATFSQHSPRTDLVQRVLSSLNLEAADAAKLSKITQLIDNLNQPQIRQSFKTPAKAGNELVKIMKAWGDCRD